MYFCMPMCNAPKKQIILMSSKCFTFYKVLQTLSFLASSGTPKGVIISHKAMIANITGAIIQYGGLVRQEYLYVLFSSIILNILCVIINRQLSIYTYIRHIRTVLLYKYFFTIWQFCAIRACKRCDL